MKFSICDNIDGSQGYYAKLNKADRQIPYDFIYMWNLKTKQMNKHNKTESQKQRKKQVVVRGVGVGEMNRTGDGDEEEQISSYRVNESRG